MEETSYHMELNLWSKTDGNFTLNYQIKESQFVVIKVFLAQMK